VYVQSLRLSKIGISATTKLKEVVGMLDGDGAAGFNPGSALMQAGLKIFATVGVTLAEVDHAPITIDALELPRKGKDHFTTQQALVAELTAHLVHQARHYMIQPLVELFGGANVIVVLYSPRTSSTRRCSAPSRSSAPTRTSATPSPSSTARSTASGTSARAWRVSGLLSI
jgi:hypothetical protein